MPSPPAAVSSSHHATPAATDVRVGRCRPRSRRVGADSVRVGRRPAGRRAPRCQPWSRSANVAPSDGEHLERREPHAVEAVGRPAVAPVGVGERRRRWRPARRVRSSRSPTSTPRAAAALAAPPTAAGSAARAAAPTAAYWSRSRSSALADHGSSSASSSSQSVSELVPQAGRGRPPRAAGRAARSVSAGVEERPAGAGVDRAGRAVGAPKRSRAASASRQTSTTAREPMCFSSQTPRVDAVGAVRGERLGRVLQQVRPRRGRRRAPSSAAGTAASAGRRANRLITSSAPAAFSSRTVTRPWWRGLDDALAEHVGEVEQRPARAGRRRSARRAAGNGLAGSYQTCSAGTETSSRSG